VRRPNRNPTPAWTFVASPDPQCQQERTLKTSQFPLTKGAPSLSESSLYWTFEMDVRVLFVELWLGLSTFIDCDTKIIQVSALLEEESRTRVGVVEGEGACRQAERDITFPICRSSIYHRIATYLCHLASREAYRHLNYQKPCLPTRRSSNY